MWKDAIKILYDNISKDETDFHNFSNEAELMGEWSIHTVNVVKVEWSKTTVSNEKSHSF